MARTLFADVTGCRGIEQITVSTSHSSSVSSCTISCIETDLDIGDEITVNLGYTDDYDRVFTGYVKNLDHTTPNNVYQITAMDKLVRAVDYFIVSSSPDAPYNFGKNVPAEDLVNNVLGLAGLSLYSYQPTHFEFGINNDVEVNLVSAFDYARMIGDIVTWNLWADEYGLIYFKNRKPFLMGANNFGQLEWVADVPINTIPLDSTQILNLSYKRDEKDLRNRVNVFGGSGISSIADNTLSWDDSANNWTGDYISVLPNDFYKSIVASYVFIDDQTIADDIADYNLGLYNRVRNSLSITCEGNHRYLARKAIKVKEWITGIPETDWYILSSEIQWSAGGFTNTMELVR